MPERTKKHRPDHDPELVSWLARIYLSAIKSGDEYLADRTAKQLAAAGISIKSVLPAREAEVANV